MKKLILFLCCLNLSYAATKPTSSDIVKSTVNTPKQIVTINKIAAWVNKGVITSNQVENQSNQLIKSLAEKKITPPPLKDLKAKVLEDLIMQKIQLDMALRNGIKTTDLEVADAINHIAKSQNLSFDDFKNKIQKQGLPFSQFQEQIRNQITLDKLKQREVDARVSVNDDEINRILHSEAFKNQVDYDLSDILISIPEQANAQIIAQKQQLASDAYNALKTQPFNQVAIQYSSAPNALTGGNLGWRSSATLPPIISQALKSANATGITQVIQLPIGFFIFKINAVKNHSSPQIVRQYKVRHILIKVNENNSDNDAHQKILTIRQRLMKYQNESTALNQEFIKEAKEYSEDTSSINGGEIGWIAKGDTVPAFESVVLTIPVGQISEPIKTPFGWHILEVTAIRDSNLTKDREKAEIRQEIRDSKASMLYNQWLRDIREAAYVKINHN